MRVSMICTLRVAARWLAGSALVASAQDTSGTIVIRAATILDGRGGRIPNGAIVVRGSRIDAVLQGAQASAASRGAAVYDLGDATILPGLIDGHVHPSWYFNARGRLHSRDDGDTPAQATLAIADNLRRMVMSGVTTAQSMGAAEDADFRDAIASGRIVGPTLLSTLGSVSNERFSPDSLRGYVRGRKAAGADAIKIFASRSIRDSGTTTMNADQMQALCGEARALGLRTLVHAHSAESMRIATEAGCTQIEHGVFATQEVLTLMAQRGTFFSPQCGLIFRNYLENRARYEGIGNYNEAGFAAMERALPVAANVVRLAANTPQLKLVWGTDAVAGAHGRQVDDLICRVREAGQAPMSAIVSATSGAADALGRATSIGSIATGYRADIIGVAGDPVARIEDLRRVTFVMTGGVVRKLEGAPTVRAP